MAEPLEYPVSIPGIDDVLDKFKTWQGLALTLDEAMAKLDGRNLSIGKLTKAVEGQAAAQERAKKATVDQSEAIELMASRAEMAAKRLGLQDEAAAQAVKIGTQYASILRETGSAQSELMKAWQAGLSPAENSARKLVVLSSKSEDLILKSHAAANAVGELSLRLEDQARRAAMNIGPQNKLSRSLSELMDQQRQAITVGQVFSLTLETKILESLKKTEGAVGSLAAKFLTFDEAGAIGLTGMGTKALLAGAAVGGVALAVGALGKAAIGAALDTYELIDSFADAADRLGVSATALSDFRYAMLQTDVSQETLGVGLKTLSKTLYESHDPTSKQAKLLQALGFDTESAAFKSMDATQVMIALAGKLQNVESETDKVAIAQQLLGKAGNELLPILNMGAVGLQGMIDKNRELGMTINNETLKAVGDYEKASKDLTASWESLKATSSALLPYLTGVAKALTGMLNPGALPIEDQIRGLRKELEAMEQGTSGFGDVGTTGKSYADLTAELEKLLRQRTLNQNATLAAAAASEAETKATQANLDALNKKTEKSKADTSAKRAATEASQKHAAQLKAEESAAKAIEASLDRQRESALALIQKGLEPLEEATAKYADTERELAAAMISGVISSQQYAQGIDNAKGSLDKLWASEANKAVQSSGVGLMEIIMGSPASVKASADSVKGAVATVGSAFDAASGWAGTVYDSINDISRAVTGLDLAALFRAQGPDAGKALVDGLMTALEDAPALVGGIADALIGGVKELAADAGALADLSVGVVEAIAEALPELAKEMPALASALIEALVPEIPTLVAEIVKMSPEIGAAIGFGLAEVILEALGLDKQAAQLDEVYRVGGAEFKARTQSPDKPLAQQGPTSSDRALMLTLDDMQRALVKHGQVLDSFRDSITYLFQSLTLKGALTRK